MRHRKRLGLATAMILLTTCGMTGSSPATTLEPANTEFTLTSTNTVFILQPQSIPYSCASSTITGDTGTTAIATTSTAPTITSLTFSNCTSQGFLLVNVTTSERCQTPATRPVLHFMGAAGTVIGKITLPTGCDIDLSTAFGCTLTITGGQTIGNATAGTGGISWTDLSPRSTAHFNSAHIPVADSNGAPGCPLTGVDTGALVADYSVSSATNVTVTP